MVGVLDFPRRRILSVDIRAWVKFRIFASATEVSTPPPRLDACLSGPGFRQCHVKVGVEAMVMTDETVVDVLEVAEKVLVEVSERVKVRGRER